MCGIAGWVSYDTDLTRHRGILDAMTETMACRGPDSSGSFIRSQVGLGHRRLAVIDLAGGGQPMTVDTPHGEVAMIYSGETYNFVELRQQLSALGHRFRTDSDTEVVLHGYLQWGEGVVDHLNGMYALAVWDHREQKLVLIRDRLGIKPLYYQPTPDGALFGSEPKAILAHPSVRAMVDIHGLRELFAMTKTPGWSLWKGMHEVPPATIVTVDRAGIRSRTYWKLEAVEHTDSRHDTITHIKELMTDIVDRQFVSDVPQCVLLSGGLDSSALTGLAAAGQGQPVTTFSVDFVHNVHNFTPDEQREAPDSPFARQMAAFVDSDHHEVMLDPAQVADPAVRRAAITARDIPSGIGDKDASLYLLFKAIRERSTVALSGESADEVFAGYHWFFDTTAVTSDTFPWLAFANPLGGACRIDTINPALLTRLELDDYVADQYSQAVAQVEHLPGESGLEHRMRTICHLHLTRFVQMLLDRKDRLSMAVGLEVRVPFCDHRLVEYVYNTPWSLKTFDRREKSLLRHATSHVLPPAIAGRVKSPYPSTQDPGYGAELQRQTRQILSESGNPVFELIDRAWLEQAVKVEPTSMPGGVRTGLDRVLDLNTWLDLYSPALCW